jgi:hypothetical protein
LKGISPQGNSLVVLSTLVELRRTAHLRDGKTTANLARQQVGQFHMAWDGLDVPRLGVAPQGMGLPLALEDAAVLAQVLE